MLAMCTLGQSCINPMANLFGSQRDLLTFDDQLLTKIGMDFGGFVLPKPIQLGLPNLLFLGKLFGINKKIFVFSLTFLPTIIFS